VNDTRPAPNPAPLLPDEAAWRRLSVQLARRAAALSEPLAVARLHHQRGEVERLELDDATTAQGSYERALDESPGFVPAELALRDLALSRDDPAAASTLFDRVVALPLLGGEARERAEFFESFLLAWLFRWRDPQKAVVCLRALEAMEPAPRLVRALEPLFVEAEVRRDRLRARFEESPPGAERAALGGALAMLLRDELDDGDTAYAVLDACADEDTMSAWLLCEAHAEAADAEGLVAALERLARLLPGSMAAALHHLCGELSEHRLGDPLRADVFYERSRGGTFHAAVSVRRVLQSLSGGARATQPGVSSADLLVRRYAEEAEALDELGLGRVFARRAVAFAHRRGETAYAERLARDALTRAPDDEYLWTYLARAAWRERRWSALTELWRARGERGGAPTDQTVDRLVRSAIAEHARFDAAAAVEALTTRGGEHRARADRDLTALRALQRLRAVGSAGERVRAWQNEADATDHADRRLDLFLKIGRTLLRHTHEHEKALTYLFWVLDGAAENLSALRLVEGICRARGSMRPLAETLARELPLLDLPQDRAPLARELARVSHGLGVEPERGVALWEAAYADDPTDSETIEALARGYGRLGRDDALHRLWQTCLVTETRPEVRAQAHVRLAELALRLQRGVEDASAQVAFAETEARLAGALPAMRDSLGALRGEIARRRATLDAELAEFAEGVVDVELDLDDELDTSGPLQDFEGPPTRPEIVAAPFSRDEADPFARFVGDQAGGRPLPPLPTPSPAMLRASNAPSTLGSARALTPPPKTLPPGSLPPLPSVSGRVTPVPAPPPLPLGEETERAREDEPARAVIARKLRRARGEPDAPTESWPDHGSPMLVALVEAVVDAERTGEEASVRAARVAELARAYTAEGALADAARAWKAVLAWRSGDAEAEGSLVEVMRRLASAGDTTAAASLAEVLVWQAERSVEPTRRHALLLELSRLRRVVLADPIGSAEALRAALAVAPAPEARAEVVEALRTAGLFDAQAELLAWPATAPEQAAGPVALEVGRVFLVRAGAAEKALPWLVRAAEACAPGEADPDLAVCLAALGRVSEALARIDASTNESAPTATQRIRLARLLEEQGVDVETVRGLYVAAFESGSRDDDVLDRVEQLAVATRNWALVARVVRAQLDRVQARISAHTSAGLGGATAAAPAEWDDERRDLAVRLGHLYYKRLDRPEEAAVAFLEAYRLQPGDLGLFRVLEGLFARHPSPPRQIELCALFLDGARPNPRERAARTLELATLLEAAGRVDEALDRLESAPRTPEIEAALERLLPVGERWATLVELLRGRLRTSEAGREPLLRRLAGILETGLRDLAGATDVLRELVALVPHDLAAIKGLCRLFEAQKRWEELLDASEAELAFTPEARQQAWILFRMGSVQETQLGKLDAAARSYKRALELDPRCFPALHGLRELAVASGHWVLVLQYLAREAELWDEPRERAAICARMAEVHLKHLGDRDQALVEYRRAVTVHPACLPALQALADDAVAREAWEEAAPWYQVLTAQNLERWPKGQRAQVLFERGRVAFHLGRFIEAAECMRLALDFVPEHTGALELLVESAPGVPGPVFDDVLARIDKAERAAEAARDDERRAACAARRGRAFARTFDLERADQELRRAVHLQPRSMAALRPWVGHLVGGRRITEAVTELRRFAEALTTGAARALDEPGVQAVVEASLWEAALWTDHLERPDRALEPLRRVLEHRADHFDAQFQIALSQRLLGRGHEARDALHALLARAERVGAPPVQRARWHHALGRLLADLFDAHEAAVAEYEAALRLDPTCPPAVLALLRAWVSLGRVEAVDAWLEAHSDALVLPPSPDPSYGLLCIFVARRRRALGDRAGARSVLVRLTEREGPNTRDARLALLAFAEEDGQLEEALDQLARLLERDVCDVEALRRLSDLAGRSRREDRLLATLDALDLYQALDPDRATLRAELRRRADRPYDRTARAPADALVAQTLHHPAFESPIVSVMGALDPALARLFGDRPLPPTRRLERPVPEWRWVQGLAGQRGLELEQADDLVEPIALRPGERPAVVLGQAFFAPEIGPAHRRFWLARAVFHVRSGTTRAHELETERALELMRAIEGLFTPSADTQDRAASLLDALPPRVAETLRPEIERRRQGTLPALYTGESALTGIVRSADRFGLLAAGSLRVAVECSARTPGAPTVRGDDLTWAVRASPRLQDLVRWGISEPCATLRRVAGLGL
jgi:tetratricopeptide (TPR) repeat protein